MFKSPKQKQFFLKLSKKSLNSQKEILNQCPSKIVNDLQQLIRQICNNSKVKLTKNHIKKLRKFRFFSTKDS